MFRSKKNEDGDDDDEFLVSSRSSKLAALFTDESSTKSSKDLKYVAPKQPLKGQINSESHHSPLQSDSSKTESNSAILYATAAELYSYKKGTAGTEGRVMCCIIRKNEDCHFVLLIYRTKKNVIAQARIHFNSNILVQKNNYINFTDDANLQWSLHIEGAKFQEFLTQIGICRSLSAFASPSPPSLVTQLLSEGEEGSLLQKGDTPLVTFCSWQVQNYKRGKQIGELKESVQLKLVKNSWEMGLVNCHQNQHCLIFVPNVQVYETDKSSLIVYEVTIESVKKEEKLIASEMPHNENDVPTQASQQGSDASHKASLISRMARVGQPLLPTTPKKHLTNHPTDSESEIEDHHHQRYHHSSNVHSNARSSTSSSLEEISIATKSQNKSNYVPLDDNRQFEGHLAGLAPLGHASYVSQGPGTVIAYHPFHFQQNQHHQQQQNESTSKNSDSLLSLLFSESRSQNTDLRIALSQLTQKVDMVYAKVNTIETCQPRSNSATQPNSALSVLSTSTQFNPVDTLNQITAMVEQIESYKRKVDENEKKMEELSKDYTQVLKKNQTLLEEKAELVALKGENSESKNESKLHIQELLLIQEKKVKVETELNSAQMQIKNLQRNCDLLREKYSTLETEIDLQKTNQLKRDKEEKQKTEILLKAEDENERLRNEIEQMHKNEEAHKEVMMKNEGKIEEMTELLTKSKREREKKEKEIVKLEEDKTQLRVKLNDLQHLKKETNYKMIEEQEVIIELLRNELQSSEKKLTDLEVESGKRTETFLTERLKGKSSPSKCEFEDVPNRCQTEALVKQIMNATYRKLKTSFRDSQTYEKGAILQNVLAAIRDTTLQYLEKPQSVLEDGKERQTKKGSEHPEENLSLTSPKVSRGTTEMAATFVTPPVMYPVTTVSDSLVSIPPEPMSSVADDSVMPVPDELLTTVPIVREFVPVPPVEETFIPPPRVTSLGGERATVNSVRTDDLHEKPKKTSNTDEKLEEKPKDEDDWRPVPPPPPLFSDSEDDDWLS